MRASSVLGMHGEDIATSYFQHLGYINISRNVRTPFGELDIVARKGNTIVIAEVKTRSSFDYGLPEEAVTKTKRIHLQKSSLWFMQKHQVEYVQVDVISVMNGKVVSHIQNIEIA